MTRYFVPYLEGVPAVVEINGHRMILVSSEEESVDDLLSVSGADDYREIEVPDSELSKEFALADLAGETAGGIVITPPGISPDVIVSELGNQLPWLH
jgi:hypothetical protein